MQNSYRFFQNIDCQFFPCHSIDTLNCLFCYCPLYNYECGGNYTILSNGVKDCSNCDLPHMLNGYDYIIDFLINKIHK
jgi:hypothetical protein